MEYLAKPNRQNIRRHSMRTHQEIDQRSLALHRLVAERIMRDPALFEKARLTLARWRRTVCVASQPYLEEWERLMNQGIEACLSVAVEDSQRAAALRQSSPFAGVLTNRERFACLKQWRNDHEAQ
ncbi:MAG: hypothetical protein WAS49_07990 [Candidatus Dechloromonas phosphoritropha]|jgi:hypothetical protein